MSGMLYLTSFNPILIESSSVSSVSLLTCSVLSRMAPYCYICSYRQQEGRLRPLFHLHYSAREVRIMAGVEYRTGNHNYMCPTCMVLHPTWTDDGLHVVLSDSQLHGVHHPRDPQVVCGADPFHIDWNTISGGTIADLTHAFLVDYKRQVRPMRVFVSAGLNDIIKSASRDTVVERFMNLKEVIDRQNIHHPHAKNELTIATLLNPPKLVWFDGNGPPPSNFTNHLQDLKEINSWIKFFNTQNGRVSTPCFHRFGVRTTKASTLTSIQTHQLSQWRASEPVHDMVHLSDLWRVRMAKAVIKYFTGEKERFGILD